jgi:hypothetical protein
MSMRVQGEVPFILLNVMKIEEVTLKDDVFKLLLFEILISE